MSRRPPVRRRRRGHRARRGGLSAGERIGLGLLGAALVWSAVAALVRRLVDNPPVLVAAAVLAAGAGAFAAFRLRERARWERIRQRGLRYALPQIDALAPAAFEEAVRELMSRDGCPRAVRVGGAGDNGADVKATDPFGRLWVIQCKHRRAGSAGSPVGTPDLQVLNGTGRPVHGGDVVVLVTNGRITDRAVAFARSQRLHLVDRALLARWAGGSTPLWELLRAVPPPRRPTRYS
ncbi:restriction endonuclease [Streptomyces sp. LP05-1]|uniref:Restriction endonuclease n=1 Tax=Streptomyces pyxinae TaxID=2970734 RepID=A0ABT2CHD4_9ACTN|nr:restriction endonuclease [Streptomyces sp. LP05-1]MCS0636822.1 restriction endonuclease [Streptomyces sp. LP05-1]